jgi:hypothetical protein
MQRTFELEEIVQQYLLGGHAPHGYQLSTDGAAVIVRYSDVQKPLRTGEGTKDDPIRMTGEQDLEQCRVILSADQSLQVEQEQLPNGRYQLRITDTLPS